MLVFRIEHEDGIGPYQSDRRSDIANRMGDVRRKLRDMYIQSHSRHPSISFDVYEFTSKHVCGFHSEEQCRNWFGPVFDDLHNAGFKLVTYSVNEYYVQIGKSGKQIAFVKSMAKLIKKGTMPLQ